MNSNSFVCVKPEGKSNPCFENSHEIQGVFFKTKQKMNVAMLNQNFPFREQIVASQQAEIPFSELFCFYFNKSVLEYDIFLKLSRF